MTNSERARAFMRSYEAFDPNGRGQPRYPTEAQARAIEERIVVMLDEANVEATRELEDKIRTLVTEKDRLQAACVQLEDAWVTHEEELAKLRAVKHEAQNAVGSLPCRCNHAYKKRGMQDPDCPCEELRGLRSALDVTDKEKDKEQEG